MKITKKIKLAPSELLIRGKVIIDTTHPEGLGRYLSKEIEWKQEQYKMAASQGNKSRCEFIRGEINSLGKVKDKIYRDKRRVLESKEEDNHE